MAAYVTRAVNTATGSRNRIHSDEVAREHGFKGGLVPGVAGYAYLTHPVVERWGAEWLRSGALHVRLLKPLYDGDEVRVELEGQEVRLENGQGLLCVAGEVRFGEPVGAHLLRAGPRAPTPAPPATAEEFRRRPVLEALRTAVTEEQARAYLETIREGLPVYPAERIVHPGQVLSLANDVLMANFTLPPWIHVESLVVNEAAPRWAEPLEVRARLLELSERKGHELVTLEVHVLGEGGRPLARITHTAIYRLRAAVG